MAKPKLVLCPVCIGQVSSEAWACPHCGHPLKETFGQAMMGLLESPIFAILVSVVAFGSIYYLIEVGYLNRPAFL